MHAHERTLIQQIGADTDHKTPAHDAACLYLQSRAQLLAEKFLLPHANGNTTYQQKLSAWIERRENEWKQCEWCRISKEPSIEVTAKLVGIRVDSTSLEVPLTKGIDQYRSHIGFFDLKVVASVIYERTAAPQFVALKRRCTRCADEDFEVQFEGYSETDNTRYNIPSLVVEVKTTRCPIGDLIRQMKLYRNYCIYEHVWLVATTYAMTEREVDALRNESIHAIRINDDYAAVDERPATVDTF